MERILAHRYAVLTALQYCRIYGLRWKKHILPKKDNGRLVGFYILDETMTTTVATVRI